MQGSRLGAIGCFGGLQSAPFRPTDLSPRMTGTPPRGGFFMSAPSCTFLASDADAYDQLMGRWSRRLATRFLDFVGVTDGAVLDVGCGTGSLTAALLERPDIHSVHGIDVHRHMSPPRRSDMRAHVPHSGSATPAPLLRRTSRSIMRCRCSCYNSHCRPNERLRRCDA